jgi:hypothetical protein
LCKLRIQLHCIHCCSNKEQQPKKKAKYTGYWSIGPITLSIRLEEESLNILIFSYTLQEEKSNQNKIRDSVQSRQLGQSQNHIISSSQTNIISPMAKRPMARFHIPEFHVYLERYKSARPVVQIPPSTPTL